MKKLKNRQDFEKAVLKSQKIVIVDFWAPWCGPSQILSPLLEEIAGEYGESIELARINIDESSDLAMRCGIASIPTVKIFKRGKTIGEIIGAAPKKFITSKLDNCLAMQKIGDINRVSVSLQTANRQTAKNTQNFPGLKNYSVNPS